MKVWIQHHPTRADLLPRLIESTGLPTEVVTDDGPLPANPWRGYKLCLERLVKERAKHGVILQDDAVLCQNFGPTLKRIARAKPQTPVVLFLGGLPIPTAARARKAAKRKESYVTLSPRDFCPVVGMLWPKTKAKEFLEWVSDQKLPNARSDDAVVGYWANRTNQEIYVTVPSLVQHPDDESIAHPKRAKKGADRGRVALQFCEGDPLLVDWS